MQAGARRQLIRDPWAHVGREKVAVRSAVSGILIRSASASRKSLETRMQQRYICVLTLAVFGAAPVYSQITLNPVAERSVGTPQLIVENSPQSPNLVEGRELYAPQAVALDNSVSPPILYVSDYVNNRVLAWKNAATFTTGQKADLAIGQPDLDTTFPQGPSQQSSTVPSGVTRPSGLAVDGNGNLYVADAGNNRVLRFPKPFTQTGQFPEPDLWIGQATVGGYGPNYPGGTSTPTAQGLYLSTGAYLSSLAFDSSGNLWVLDTGNARVIRFNAASLSAGGGSLTADTVIGQPSLTSNSPALASNASASYLVPNQFVSPLSITFDPSGNLWVGDLGRVLVFPGPNFTSGMNASTHVLGIFPSGYTFPTGQTALQALLDSTSVQAPEGIFFLSGGAGVGVVDAGLNRIMIFPPFASWPSTGPPSATTILGQPNTCTQSPNQTCKAANNGNVQPSGLTFSAPSGVAYTGTDLYLADSGNNRVLDLPQTGSTFGAASRILGQDFPYANSPNLIEGREFQFTGTVSGSNGLFSDAGMAIDNGSGTPHLYVADPYNNRVLGFKDLRKFQNGAKNKADIVLGQADFTTGLINFPSGNANTPNSSGLYRPIGLVVDAQGNLYVADSLNGRVLRFPAPFSYTGAAPEPADLVLGQSSFTATIPDLTANNMALPYGLAFSPSCNTASQACASPNGLVVSDEYFNRVLYIPTTNGTFVAGTDNGKAATVVFGQSGFNAKNPGNTQASMNSPHHISCDTSGNVYVADTGNNRVLIFNDPHAAGTASAGEQASAFISGLNDPSSVYVSPVTGEIWVANTNSGASLRYANYQSVLLGLGSISSITEASGNFAYSPLATIQDQYGDLFVADTAHRLAIYYPGVNLCNGASFLPTTATSSQYPSANCLPLYDPSLKTALPSRPLAPGVIATIFPCENCAGTQFLTTQNVFQTYPVPTQLGDVEVLVNGIAAPLYIVYPGQINFIVPQETAGSGNADLEVVQVSTGQVLGAAQVPMNSVAPGAFLYPGGQTGATVYAAAINKDGTINSATNPAVPGDYVSLYLTGEGAVPGEPADGVPATSAISTQGDLLTVLINGIDVNSATYQEQNIQHILYSGINQYPGMWQINLQIPKTVVTASGAVWFVAILNGVPNWDASSPFKTYIYVK
jgi:uncharacterized protein (TIGR03437 family)